MTARDSAKIGLTVQGKNFIDQTSNMLVKLGLSFIKDIENGNIPFPNLDTDIAKKSIAVAKEELGLKP